MKALKDFDYNLWTTVENGVKKYYVGIKATGEVTEVDAEVMKLLRNEEKKMRRRIEEDSAFGTPLSLDSAVGDECNNTWLTDSYDFGKELQMEIMEESFINSLSQLQKEIYECCIKNEGSHTAFANAQGISKQAVSNTIRKIREKAKKYFS